MLDTTCFAEPNTANDVRLNEDEVIALMINLIAFEGDWDKHLTFLQGLENDAAWQQDQIPLVQEMMYKDVEFDIQGSLCGDED